MFNLEHGALKIWSAQGAIPGLIVNDILIDSPTFSGLQLDGAYAITSASFDTIEITNAGTDGIFLRVRDSLAMQAFPISPSASH